MKIALVKIAVKLLMLIKRVYFPVRQIGGEEWVYSWRLRHLTNSLEKESLLWCRKLVAPGKVVVDIGAHIGYFTRYFSKLVGQHGKLLAFEPFSENFEILSQNVKRDRYNNVKVYKIAISSKDEQGNIFISPGHSNHSLIAGYTKNLGKESVEISSLDSALEKNQYSEIDFIKIDVEGNEINVLNGMRETIANSPNLCMLVEYNPKALISGGFDPRHLLELMDQLGFESYRINSDGSLDKSIRADNQETFNLLCIPIGASDRLLSG